MKKELFDEKLCPVLRVVLHGMCLIGGCDFESIDFSAKNWFHKHTWTKEEQDAFRDWLADLVYDETLVRNQLLEHPIKNKKYCKRFADEFVFSYGWRIKEVDVSKP